MPRASQRPHAHSDSRDPRKTPGPIEPSRLPNGGGESLEPILDWSFFESLVLPGENVAYSLHDGSGVFLDSTSDCENVWSATAKQLRGSSVFGMVEDGDALRNWMLQTDSPETEKLLQVTVPLSESRVASINLKSIPIFIASAPHRSRIVLKAALSEYKDTGNPFTQVKPLRSVHKPDGAFISANSHWQSILVDKRLCLSLFDLAIEQDRYVIRSFFQKIQDKRSSQTCVIRLRPSHGQQRALLLTGKLEPASSDAIEIEAKDVTLDRGNLASSLLKVSIEFINESVLILHKEERGFRICYVNRAFESMTGHGHSNIVGCSISQLKGPGTNFQSAQSIEQAIDQEQDFQTELLLYRKDKTSFWSKVDLRPLRDDNGRADFFLLTLEDATEAKDVADELENRNGELKEALRNLKDTQRTIIQQENLRALGQMASGIAHDFNNLLAPILGFSELLLTIPENAKNEKKLITYLKKIQVAAKDGAAVVGRLREFYRSQNGDEEFIEISPEELVQQAKEITSHRWKNQAEAKGITINLETSVRCRKRINGNPSELRQVLTNLVINAVDAIAETGTIRIDVIEVADTISFKISDNGSGMSPETKAKCLDPFYTTKGKLGTGLGLSIVLGVVQRHRGKFNIESELGKGTEIEMTFPAIEGKNDAPAAPVENRPFKKLRVLLVDDEEVLLEVISELLGSSGHIVDNYSDPEEALSEFKANHYDLVITDRAMPTMSGDQLAKAIKAESPTTPGFMVTGFGDLIKETGDFPEFVDEVLAKPIPLDLLNQKVNELVAKKKG